MNLYTYQKQDSYNQNDIEQLEKIEGMLEHNELCLQEGMSLSMLGVDRTMAFKSFLDGLNDIVSEISKVSDEFLRDSIFDLMSIHIAECNEKLKQFNVL